jgi:hypothetical protein
MSFRDKLIRAIVPGACVFAFALAARAEDYKVVLNRPDTVGQTYSIHATGQSSQNMTVDVPGAGPQKQSDSFKAELQGTIKVLAIDDHTKQATKIQCTLDKLTKDDKPVLDAGTVVTAENAAGQTTFTVNGNPVEPTVAPVLDLLISVHKAGSPSDDEMFGTDKAVPVGGTWPINTAAAAADAAKSGLPITKDNLHGDAKLVGVKDVGGKQVLDVAADMTADNLSGAMPNGGKIESGSVKAHFTGLFPTDPAQQPAQQGQTLEVHMKASAVGPDGKAVSIEMSMTRSMTADFGDGK